MMILLQNPAAFNRLCPSFSVISFYPFVSLCRFTLQVRLTLKTHQKAIVSALLLLHPQTQGIHAGGDFFKLSPNKIEIRLLVRTDESIGGDVNKAVALSVDGVKAAEKLQHDICKILLLHRVHEFSPDGAFLRAVVVTQLRRVVAFRQLQNLVRMGKGLLALDLLDAGGGDGVHPFAGSLPGETRVLPAALVDILVFLHRSLSHARFPLGFFKVCKLSAAKLHIWVFISA